MSEFLDSIKSSIAVFEKYSETTKRETVASEFKDQAAGLKEAADEMRRLIKLSSAIDPDLGDIHDLPKALRDELSVSKDDLDDYIVTVINAFGGTASLDQLLIGLYEKFEIIQKRKFIMNKLYRMPQVWSVEGKKGVYTTQKPEAPDHQVERDDINGSGYSDSDLDEALPF